MCMDILSLAAEPIAQNAADLIGRNASRSVDSSTQGLLY